jgi:DNA-binding MarR family transcriptional regulator
MLLFTTAAMLAGAEYAPGSWTFHEDEYSFPQVVGVARAAHAAVGDDGVLGGNMRGKPPDKPTRVPLADDERNAMKRLALALGAFRQLRTTMPLQYVMSFLLIAQEEGLGVSEYAARAGVSPSVMSRHLLDIGDRNRHLQDGFGLVTSRQNFRMLRRSEYFLTPKGRALAHEIFRQLEP